MAATLPQSLIVPLATIRRERQLLGPGEIAVRPGQKVEPLDVVARVQRSQGYRTVDVARSLKLRPSELEAALAVAPGDTVAKGDALARRRAGLFGRTRTLKSPVDGVVAAIGNGRVVIEIAPETVELRALVRGTVISAMSSYGVVIETHGALIQAAWGSGKEAYGVIKIASDAPGQPLTGDDIDVSCRGTILVGSGRLEESAIRQAVQMQVRGLIGGSLPADLARAALELPFPLVVTEGLGNIAMAEAAFTLLRTNEGRECAVDGRTPGQAGGSGRPDIIIPLPVLAVPPLLSQHGQPVRVGARVRALRQPYQGAIGEVKTLHDRARPLPTGALLPGAEVDLEGHGVVFVPYANLELIGQ
jgi:hypothetical protein